MGQVYGIRRADTGQLCYIGASRGTAANRFRGHLAAVQNASHHNSHFASIVNKVGVDALSVEVLAEASGPNLWELEAEKIQEATEAGHRLANYYHTGGAPPVPMRQRRIEPGAADRLTEKWSEARDRIAERCGNTIAALTGRYIEASCAALEAIEDGA